MFSGSCKRNDLIRSALSGASKLAAFSLVLAACTTGAVTPPAEVDTCGGLVTIGVDLVETWVEVVETLPVDVMVGDATPPQVVVDLGATGEQLDERAQALGCDLAELNTAISEATADLVTDDPAADLVLKVVREGALVNSIQAVES
ncbi:MAG: hypothetical protein IIB04_03390 [Acidobacteria bacterium]|nr:hypothetical protein [Acidobacteriota bacterium]